MIKSPLRYPGGKSRAVKYIYQFIPEYYEFREPFFGGGSVSFYCNQIRSNAKYYASDINYDLYCFWNILKQQPDELIEEVSRIKKTYEDGKRLFYEILERRENALTDFQRAVDFFVLNRITFSGVVDSGGYSNQSFHKRFTISSIDRLKMAHEVVKEIDFTSNDYSNLLFKEGKDVFIFLDPPYYSATKSKLYGKNGTLHTNFDHKLFFENLKNCKYKWLITYDDSDFIKDLFKDFYIIDWKLQYGMNNYKQEKASKGEELLIGNYNIEEVLYKQRTFL